jgi:hypothetical protein
MQICDVILSVGADSFDDHLDVIEATQRSLRHRVTPDETRETACIKIAYLECIIQTHTAIQSERLENIADNRSNPGCAVTKHVLEFPQAGPIEINAVAKIRPPIICENFHWGDVLEAGISDLENSLCRGRTDGILVNMDMSEICSSGHAEIKVIEWMKQQSQDGLRDIGWVGENTESQKKTIRFVIKEEPSIEGQKDKKYEEISMVRTKWTGPDL